MARQGAGGTGVLGGAFGHDPDAAGPIPEGLGPNAVGIAEGQSNADLAASIDWAIDVSQFLFIAFLPIAALCLARADEHWALEAGLAIGMVSCIVGFIVLSKGPFWYSKLITRGYSVLTLCGMILNITIGLILGFGWFESTSKPLAIPAPISTSAPTPTFTPTVMPVRAAQSLKITSVERIQQANGANVVNVRIHVSGGLVTVGERKLWIAFGPENDLNDPSRDPASYAPAPCMTESDAENWICKGITLSDPGKHPRLVIFPLFADIDGVAGILRGWVTPPNQGVLIPPTGVDFGPSYQYDVS